MPVLICIRVYLLVLLWALYFPKKVKENSEAEKKSKNERVWNNSFSSKLSIESENQEKHIFFKMLEVIYNAELKTELNSFLTTFW